ncbi:MAG: HlyD family efflux transporter periplasmic adaptor subunit, partial [Pseudomonadota bacterium]
DYANLQLSYAHIYSPATGIISKKNVQVGQFVQAGQPLFSIVQDSSIWITANFKETQLEEMRVNEEVDIHVDAFPDLEVKGSVESLSGVTGAKSSLLPPDNASGNFIKVVQRVPVKIKITADKETIKKLKPGMSVSVAVVTK